MKGRTGAVRESEVYLSANQWVFPPDVTRESHRRILQLRRAESKEHDGSSCDFPLFRLVAFFPSSILFSFFYNFFPTSPYLPLFLPFFISFFPPTFIYPSCLPSFFHPSFLRSCSFSPLVTLYFLPLLSIYMYLLYYLPTEYLIQYFKDIHMEFHH